VVEVEMPLQELVQQMEEAVIQVDEVHQVIQLLQDQQEQVLLTLVVVAVVLLVEEFLAVTVDQVWWQ
jgi:hypothetical protein